jgi:hypothetical protein
MSGRQESIQEEGFPLSTQCNHNPTMNHGTNDQKPNHGLRRGTIIYLIPPACLGTSSNTSPFAVSASLFTASHSTRATAMSLVGTLLFCTACGDLLDRAAPAVPKIACRRCHALNKSTVLSPLRSSRNHGYRLTNPPRKIGGPRPRGLSPRQRRSRLRCALNKDLSGRWTMAVWRRGRRRPRRVLSAVRVGRCLGKCSCAARMRGRRFFLGVGRVRIGMSMLCCVV